MISSSNTNSKRASRMLLVGTILGGWGVPLMAQVAPPAPVPAPAQAPAATAVPTTRAATTGSIRSIAVSGAERLEAETIRS